MQIHIVQAPLHGSFVVHITQTIQRLRQLVGFIQQVSQKILQHGSPQHQVLTLCTQSQAIWVLQLVSCGRTAEERSAFVRHIEVVKHDGVSIALQSAGQAKLTVQLLHARNKQSQVTPSDIGVRQPQGEGLAVNMHHLAIQLRMRQAYI